MNWTKPQYSKSAATKAGKILAGRLAPTESLSWDKAFDVAANWRSSHGYPLQVMYVTLRNRAKRIDPEALVAQRLKRMPSILGKLRRFDSMQLSQMQDLGGCRAVLGAIDKVDELVELYSRCPPRAVEFCEKYDYIESPKDDGYRGVHLVYRYDSKDERRSIYNGLRIEVQIRSRFQHGWATAVETIDTFTGSAIKSGLGSKDWKRFFVCVSSFIAWIEKRKFVPGATDPMLWFFELAMLIEDLKAIDVLKGLGTGMNILSGIRPADFYVLVLDSRKRETRVEGFNNEQARARRYQELEKQTLADPAIQAVMVSVDSVKALRSAYPSYYLDTSVFVGILESFKQSATEAAKKLVAKAETAAPTVPETEAKPDGRNEEEKSD